LLRETYGRKVKRSPYTRAATAIGLAIQADKASGYQLRERFTRYFGVWREADGGRVMRFDPLFAKGTELPSAGEPPLEQKRTYTAVHNIGHFRYLECSHIDDWGQPDGSITVWDEIRFPLDPALLSVDELQGVPVEHVYLGQEIAETYRCGAGGELEVEIANWPGCYLRPVGCQRRGARGGPHLHLLAVEGRGGPDQQLGQSVRDAEEAEGLFNGCMAGRTMYVLPFSMGPPARRCRRSACSSPTRPTWW
jgi:hypothetical protein